MFRRCIYNYIYTRIIKKIFLNERVCRDMKTEKAQNKIGMEQN